ncbi:HTH-type transcriptional regulator HmrR [Aliiroseovarius sp. xm-m-379]|nr:HTH-type transcriptional regulator HmrR [Aliiroseovarius sp. xm-d-517]NRP24058.1 HTH-type transcriptional regulator HmrR [Aliiroseovarius sp. xm-m-379]NRP30131.1 HTH-type transcriptional regulator HmrR [Aliiroseovarius sp. xm-m-314]NRP32857.1 HTH-type transcriptional regulator HmrR [Aliiroseovarius sp. xm-a-104]NRP40416.1 HTH-type transcriptional regulator HmrR [Aliiroseovarius sp. xm-m-339-2]NRP43157.1 HTH-type transcriptional regulator HmrR [Aliiroseovarius sp. xm-m-378]NRP49698.1 HTH-ty
MNLNIGDVSKRTGLRAKTIRYYEDIGLVKPLRDTNDYRVFRETDLHKLIFLSRARALGFTIDDCRNLLALYEDEGRASADVMAITRKHLAEIEAKINDLQAMHATLTHLTRECAGDHRPDCPILEGLSGENSH